MASLSYRMAYERLKGLATYDAGGSKRLSGQGTGLILHGLDFTLVLSSRCTPDSFSCIFLRVTSHTKASLHLASFAIRSREWTNGVPILASCMSSFVCQRSRHDRRGEFNLYSSHVLLLSVSEQPLPYTQSNILRFFFYVSEYRLPCFGDFVLGAFIEL